MKEEFPSTFQCQKEVTEGGNSEQEIATIEITQSEETEKQVENWTAPEGPVGS